jgi:catechol 2,3-dioxygenase-like lactoylglutathione lyase family enzyme
MRYIYPDKIYKMKKAAALIIIIIGSFIIGYALGVKKAEHTSANGVTGIGGIFFKCKDPKMMKEWYNTNLGFRSTAYGTNFEWRQAGDSMKRGFTLWAPFKETTKYFEKEFMINYRGSHLDALLDTLAKNGILPVDTVERASYGNFVHIKDPEGNRIELWEPNDIEYYKMGPGTTVY